MGCRLPCFKTTVLLAAAMLLISSCASLSRSGVGRVKHYTFASSQVPPAFDGCRLAFISDTHYPSLFNGKRLPKLVGSLNELKPDILLLGGDYVTEKDSLDALFSALGRVDAPFGRYAVIGNHERGIEKLAAASMEKNGIEYLDDELVALQREGDVLYLAGVKDSFSDTLQACPSSKVPASEFVILLAHTPDYAERTSAVADLVLSGHTHGGQVSLFGLYTPVKNSAYGSRFLRGMNRSGSGATVITTNGVGTSRRKIRFCVPSEIVVVTLERAEP